MSLFGELQWTHCLGPQSARVKAAVAPEIQRINVRNAPDSDIPHMAGRNIHQDMLMLPFAIGRTFEVVVFHTSLSVI